MNIPNLLKYINGFPAEDEKLETFFKSVPASAYCKDKEGKYCEVNDLFIYTSDYPNASDIIGKVDSDLVWRRQAPLMMENDKKIIYTEQSCTFLEDALSFGNRTRYFLSHKLPLLGRTNKKIGTIGISFLLDDTHMIDSWLKKSGFSFNFDPSSLLNTQKNYELSPRQIDCLVYLVKGMTIKQIARQLDLSPKTVEHYFVSIRNKLNCKSRYELFTKALQIPIVKNQL